MKKLVAYARYSTNLQREASVEDQHRVCLRKFEELGIARDQVTLLADRGISGEDENRPAYASLLQAIDRDEVAILVVDDQSRLTRGPDIGVKLEQFRFHGTRLISVADGIDTAQEGTEVNAHVKGLVNNLSNKSHGKRVRRGLVGRVLAPNGSAGDHPFGYRSEWEDPEAMRQYVGHGPKPTRKVVIDEEEAGVVRWIFAMFTVQLLSINGIARRLNARKAPLGRRARSVNGWSPARVKKALKNAKYAGEWVWGAFQTVKLQGKRRNRPTDAQEVVRVKRPDLAIITQEQWGQAQARFRALKAITGTRHIAEPKKRLGIYAREYPANLLSGLLFCGECGARLHYTRSNTTAYFRCPVHAQGGACGSKSIVIQAAAEKVVLAFLRDKLTVDDGWLDAVYEDTVTRIRDALAQLPDRKEQLLKRKAALEAEAGHIVDSLKDGASKLLTTKLHEYEARIEEVDEALAKAARQDKQVAALPSREDIKRELADWVPLFTEEPVRGALLLRKALGRVEAYDMIFPGKKRGYAKLCFSFRPAKFLACVNNELSGGDDVDAGAESVVLYTGEPTRLESLLPQIHVWLQQGVQWREIGKRTGLSVCSANLYYNRWRAALEAASSTNKEEEQRGDNDDDVTDNN